MKNKVLISIIVILCLFLFVFLKDGHTKKAVEQDKKIGNVKVITTTINKENKVKNQLVNENTITTTTTTTTVVTTRAEKNTTTTKKTQNTTVSTTKVKTIKEENIELINNIEKIYGVKVSYGDGTFCWYDGDSCTILYDDTKANTALKKISNILVEFPTGFFRKFIDVNGYRIEMFDKIPGDTAGLASYEIGDDNVMYIDVNTSFVGRVFYHETWHIMEQYMYIMNNWNTVFSLWKTYNPDGFVYGDTSTNTYITMIDKISNISDIAFVSYYSKTNEREDRAELFADLMFRPYKKNYMESEYGVNEKAKYLVSIIREYWQNSSNAKWERWITF